MRVGDPGGYCSSKEKQYASDFDAGIGWKDWYGIGGGESTHVAFDADNPVLVYAGGYQGQITEFDDRTGERRDVMRYPQRTTFRPASGYPYRFNWNAPILVSQHDPNIIYHAANVLLKSSDRGQHWMEISPDLTRNEPQKQGVVEGDFTFEGTGGEMYNTIFHIAESPYQSGEIWAGSDDGRVHLTRDGGNNWTEITPGGLGELQINMVEVSRSGRARPMWWLPATSPMILRQTCSGPRITGVAGSASWPAFPTATSYASCAKTLSAKGCCLQAPRLRCSFRSMTVETGSQCSSTCRMSRLRTCAFTRTIWSPRHRAAHSGSSTISVRCGN